MVTKRGKRGDRPCRSPGRGRLSADERLQVEGVLEHVVYRLEGKDSDRFVSFSSMLRRGVTMETVASALMLRRGGFIENIRMENCTAKNVKRAVVAVETDVLYHWKKFPTHEVRVTPITDLVVRNVAVESANRLVMLKGDARCPIRNVTVENVTCGTTYAKDIVANAEGVAVR